MAAQRSGFQISKSIAGAVLLVLGTFILYQNLAGAIARLRHVIANGSQVLGVLPAIVLALSQAVHAYGFDHQRFLQGLSRQMLVASWPLLLVIFGTILSRQTFADQSNVQERSIERGPSRVPRCTYEQSQGSYLGPDPPIPESNGCG